MTLQERLKELCKDRDLTLDEVMLFMDGMSSVDQGTKKLAGLDRDTLEELSDIFNELADIIGYTVDPDRIDREFREELNQKTFDMADRLREELGDSNE